jgi:BioD-like phosphotransacetylase family protein
LAALYITSPQAGAGKTLLCAGLGRQLRKDGKKVGFFKPMVADIKTTAKKSADSDTAFLKRVLGLKEPLESLCPFITGQGKLAAKVKQAYAKVSPGKDVVLVEGVWKQRPGARPIETSAEIVEALKAKVIIVENYSPELSKARLSAKYRDFGNSLLGVVVNKVPASRLAAFSEQLSSQGGEVNILGVIPEDRLLFGLSVGELAEHVQGEIINDARKSGELVENLMLGALTANPGPEYFGRKANKAVLLKSDRPDMQLAALDSSTKCLVLSGDAPLIYKVRQGALDRGIPIIVTKGDTTFVVNSLEQALDRAKFNQEKKLPRLAEIMKQQFDFPALYQGLGLSK